MFNDIHHLLLGRASKPQSYSGCLDKSFIQSSGQHGSGKATPRS